MSLILTRKIGEAIIIDGDIRVKLIKNNRGALALKVDAPRDVNVYREEIANRRDFNPSRRHHGAKDSSFNGVLAEMDLQSRGNVK